jgi:Rrf2 family protein
MLKIGKLAQQAIAAASYLAERYSEDGTRVSAAEIADARDLPRPVVAKLLASLSQHGLTTGITDPSGGYQLARAPEDISLYDIVAAFECMDARPMCPFGPNWCGHGAPCPEAPCPLHDAIVEACEQGDHFFKSQHLGPFLQASNQAKKVTLGKPKTSSGCIHDLNPSP